MFEFWNATTNGFMPHGYCLRWDGPLLFVLILGNIGIALAYFLIPLALRHFVGKRKDLPYPHMFKLFAAFILTCGLTHLVKVWTLYQPVYWVEALLDLWTAIISMLTATLLFPLIPKALALRSPRELEEANATLQEEIKERVRAEQAAEAARDAAIRANQLKSEFMANISHEIRTPLSSMIGMAELLTFSPEPNEQKELAELLFSSSKKLLLVLNDLLDFAKLESGKVVLDFAPFSVQGILSEVFELMNTSAKRKNLQFEIAVDASVPERLVGDESKIRQILVNLASNAIKFTNSGSVSIKASAATEGPKTVWLSFVVEDTGIGIPKLQQDTIFESFIQADGSIKRQFGGTGLGLTISKQYAELMKGKIKLESEEGKGSIFRLSIPCNLEDQQ